MVENFYTDERHAQVVLALLKKHGVRKIIISPGATNIPIAASVQYDSYFEVYSCVDERSAAYMACGLAEESGEIVAISCTGATASRNYVPGLTEAFYRKIPIVAITSFNGNRYIGHLVPQNIDRTVIQNDLSKCSVQLPVVKDEGDIAQCELLVNKAILEATRGGGGPVHINLTTTYLGTFKTKKLPDVRVINRFYNHDTLPSLEGKKVCIFIGSHRKFSEKEVAGIERFCGSRQAFVACDKTSGYFGNYRIDAALILSNLRKRSPVWKDIKPEVVIHIGEVSGDYPSTRLLEDCEEVWRVSPDGELRDRAGKLRYVYEGTELSFFEKFNPVTNENKYYSSWEAMDSSYRSQLPKVPFSNTWIAFELSKKIPKESYLHLAILNSLRNWNLTSNSGGLDSTSNVGGFGIDGCLSTTIGASLVNPEKLYFCVIGDLAFFYDMNVLGNRHLGKNIRILLINNGCGAEFNISSHIGSKFKEQANEYIAAGGHFASGLDDDSLIAPPDSRKSNSLALSLCKELGVRYLQASSEEEFKTAESIFLEKGDAPVLLECFTNHELESDALSMMGRIKYTVQDKIVDSAKGVLPDSISSLARKIIK